MKSHITLSLKTFLSGCDRADGLRHIHRYLKGAAPAAMDCDDILRSSIVLAVSSFDLFLHDIVRTEVLYRLKEKKTISELAVPFNCLLLTEPDQIQIIDDTIRRTNSYKSFVAPDKIGLCLKNFMQTPWDDIASAYGDTPDNCKKELRAVVELRNRIAHEADVNPAYGGIELWPIYSIDVENSILFLRSMGQAIAQALTNSTQP